MDNPPPKNKGGTDAADNAAFDSPPKTEQLSVDVAPPVTIHENPFDAIAVRSPSTLEKVKEYGAMVVALVLVGTFAALILITLLIVLSIILFTRSPEKVQEFTDAIVPLLDALGKFLPPVFGSLLAFVLGYYFSKEQRR